MSRPSYSIKIRNKPIVIKQTGYDCFFCKCVNLELNPLEVGHLNNNVNDNRPENWAYMCHSCNVKMKYSPDMQIQAREQMVKNEESTVVCGNECIALGTDKEQTSSQAISQANNRIALDYLNELLNTRDILYCKDYVDATKNRCFNTNGTGSQSAIYRYLDSFTNSINGLFTIYTVHGKKAIRRKNA